MQKTDRIAEYRKFKRMNPVKSFLFLEELREKMAEKGATLDQEALQESIVNGIRSVVSDGKGGNKVVLLTDEDREKFVGRLVTTLIEKYDTALSDLYSKYESKDSFLKEKIIELLKDVDETLRKTLEIKEKVVTNEDLVRFNDLIQKDLDAMYQELVTEKELEDALDKRDKAIDSSLKTISNNVDKIEKSLKENAVNKKTVENLKKAIEGIGKSIREGRREAKRVDKGGGMGNWIHERFDFGSATESVTLRHEVAANSTAMLVRYQGQLLAHGVQYTISGKVLTIVGFAADDSTHLDVTYVRT